MQRNAWVKLGLVLGLSGALAGAAASAEAAALVFKSRLLCDLDATAPFADIKGWVTIKDNGDLKVTVKGLAPVTPYTCRIICNVGGLVEEAACVTDAKGKLNAKLTGLGRSGSMADGCGQPIVTVFDPAGDDFCNTGYGQDN
jgi:hypothetical protein